MIGFEHGAAAIHLNEAVAMKERGGAPNACLHAVYFGMYHAATAVLHIAGGVGRTGQVPKSHEHVLQHFTRLAEKIGDDAMDAAKLLNRARSTRITADYGGAETPSIDDIVQSVEDARRFIEICVRVLGLPPVDLSAVR